MRKFIIASIAAGTLFRAVAPAYPGAPMPTDAATQQRYEKFEKDLANTPGVAGRLATAVLKMAYAQGMYDLAVYANQKARGMAGEPVEAWPGEANDQRHKTLTPSLLPQQYQQLAPIVRLLLPELKARPRQCASLQTRMSARRSPILGSRVRTVAPGRRIG